MPLRARAGAEVRTLHAVRLGGVAFTLAVTAVFVLTLRGGHTHGALVVSNAGGDTRVPAAGAAHIPAGEYQFALERTDGGAHELALTGGKDGTRLMGRAVAGSGATVVLAPGPYTIVCTTPGHEAAGMTYRVVVVQ